MASTFQGTQRWLWLSLAFFCAFSFLRQGRLDVRIANGISDDHVVVFTNFCKAPEKWQGDVVTAVGPFFLKSSVLNKAACELERNLGVPARLFSTLLVFLQNVGLGLALLLLCRYLDPRPKFYAPLAMATYLASPWLANLAYYPSVYYVPYPGHFVQVFLVFALVAFLKTNLKGFLAALFVAAFVHPTQTLQAIAFFSIAFLITRPPRARLVPYLAGIAAIAVVAVVPHFFGVPADRLTNHELLPTLLINPHLVPWTMDSVWAFGVPTFIGILITSRIALNKLELPPIFSALWWSGLIVTGLSGVTQYAGAVFGIPELLMLCPLRVTVLISTTLLPIGFLYLLRQLDAAAWPVRISAATGVLFPVFSAIGVFWGQWMVVLRQKRALALFSAWWAIYWIAGRPARTLGFGDAGSFLRYLLAPAGKFETLSTVLILLGAAAAIVPGRRFSFQFRLGVVIAIMGLILTANEGRTTLEGKLLWNYELQKWARENTPENALFVMNDRSWRGISERRVVFVNVGPININAYDRRRDQQNRNVQIREAFLRTGGVEWEKRNESQVLSLVREFGGTHVLREASSAPLNLPVVFKNEGGVIYDVSDQAP